jgi:hypothetical protein
VSAEDVPLGVHAERQVADLDAVLASCHQSGERMRCGERQQRRPIVEAKCVREVHRRGAKARDSVAIFAQGRD